MNKLILILCFLILLPLTANTQTEDAGENSVQQETVEAPTTIEPPDWGDDEFESSFDGGEPSFGEDGDEDN